MDMMDLQDRVDRMNAAGKEFDQVFDVLSRACTETIMENYGLHAQEAAAVFGRVSFNYAIAAMGLAIFDPDAFTRETLSLALADEAITCKDIVMDRLNSRFAADLPV